MASWNRLTIRETLFKSFVTVYEWPVSKRRVGGSVKAAYPVFAQRESVPFSLFLAVKGRPFDAFDFYNRTKATWTQDNSLRYQSKPVAKVGTAEPSIKNPLYRSSPHCLSHRTTLLKIVQVSIQLPPAIVFRRLEVPQSIC